MKTIRQMSITRVAIAGGSLAVFGGGAGAADTAALLACGDDVMCVVKKVRVDAIARCKPLIERIAKNDFEWTAWTTFQQYQWREKPNVVTFLGNEIKYQNGLGAWIRHSYECDFDVASEAVVDVRAKPGRL